MIFGQRGKSEFAWRRGAIGAFVLACAFVLCARAEDRAGQVAGCAGLSIDRKRV